VRSSQAGTERVMKLRLEYWEKVKHIDQKNLVQDLRINTIYSVYEEPELQAAKG
jgi:hypothetical protein